MVTLTHRLPFDAITTSAILKKMSKTNTTTPLRSTVHTVSLQLYSLFVWLFILFGGMVAVASFFVNLPVTDVISSVIVGLLAVGFGLGMARLLNRDIKQTAPVLWF